MEKGDDKNSTYPTTPCNPPGLCQDRTNAVQPAPSIDKGNSRDIHATSHSLFQVTNYLSH